MTSLNAVLHQLEGERSRLTAELANLNKALAALGQRGQSRGKRRLSAAAIARIRAAQKKRWAKWRQEQKG
jgi:Skp family chaperone for outer membrane proteins